MLVRFYQIQFFGRKQCQISNQTKPWTQRLSNMSFKEHKIILTYQHLLKNIELMQSLQEKGLIGATL